MIVVTGARGLIGSRFFQLYSSELDLLPVDLEDGFDILDFEELVRKVEAESVHVEAILHLAAFTDVSAAYRQRDDKDGICYRVNVIGTENIVRLANHFDAHLIHVSTDFVFSGEKDVPLTEKTQPRPIEWYGETKLMAEDRVTDETEKWSMMRIAFPYLNQQGARPDLFSSIRLKLSRGEQVHLFGDQVITPSFGDDVAAAMLSFLHHKPNSELFHTTGPDSLTPFDIGLILAEVENASRSLVIKTSMKEHLLKDPRPRQKFMRIDTSKYKRFCARHGNPFPKGIRDAIQVS